MQETRTTTLWAGVAALIALVALAAALFATQPAYAADDAALAAGDTVATTNKQPTVINTSQDPVNVRIGETRNLRANKAMAEQTGSWKWTVESGASFVTLKNDTKKSAQVVGKANGVAKVKATFTTDKYGKTNNYIFTVTVTGIKSTITVNGLTYKKTGLKTVTLTGATKQFNTLRIPNQIKVSDKSGKQYKAVYGVTVVGKSALANQSKLTRVTVGTNVTTLGVQAFAKAKKLKRLDINSTKLTTTKNCLQNNTTVNTVKVPAAKYNAYKKLFTKSVCGKAVKVTK